MDAAGRGQQVDQPSLMEWLQSKEMRGIDLRKSIFFSQYGHKRNPACMVRYTTIVSIIEQYNRATQPCQVEQLWQC